MLRPPPYLRAKLHSCDIDFGLGRNVVIKLIEVNADVFRDRERKYNCDIKKYV